MCKIKADFTDPEKYCLCCHMPYVGKEHKYPLCSPNIELGEMGPGYPLYFEFVKGVGQLMLLLTIVFFAPSCYMMYDAWKDIRANLQSDESSVALFSFGAYISTNRGVDVEFKEYEKRKLYVQIQVFLMVASIIVSLLFLIYMRARLLYNALKLDDEASTPSDWCLMGMNMVFDSYDP
jgi:hypothetical protein